MRKTESPPHISIVIYAGTDQAQVVTILKRLRNVSGIDGRIGIELVEKIKADAIFLFLIIKATQTLSKNPPK